MPEFYGTKVSWTDPPWLDKVAHRLHLPHLIQQWFCWRMDKYYGLDDSENPKPWPWKAQFWKSWWRIRSYRFKNFFSMRYDYECDYCLQPIYKSRFWSRRQGHKPGYISRLDPPIRFEEPDSEGVVRPIRLPEGTERKVTHYHYRCADLRQRRNV